jgi:hypothetical protein
MKKKVSPFNIILRVLVFWCLQEPFGKIDRLNLQGVAWQRITTSVSDPLLEIFMENPRPGCGFGLQRCGSSKRQSPVRAWTAGFGEKLSRPCTRPLTARIHVFEVFIRCPSTKIRFVLRPGVAPAAGIGANATWPSDEVRARRPLP